ncbi:hypothetical protein C1H46_012187 [Malus baccata]|uniref:Uncharacterized protein n=1 Tax=Malus baccata TaxID=106549 RepID=A0A540MTQ8_MALBA|nr:hypothetical protein C1H46_012187 [Malus baccata]
MKNGVRTQKFDRVLLPNSLCPTSSVWKKACFGVICNLTPPSRCAVNVAPLRCSDGCGCRAGGFDVEVAVVMFEAIDECDAGDSVPIHDVAGPILHLIKFKRNTRVWSNLV